MSEPTERRAFLNPGGFSLHTGGMVADRDRVRRLTEVFAADLLRGTMARLFAAGFLLPALGFAIYVVVRARVGQFAVPVAEQTTFLLSNIAKLFGIELGGLLLFAAGRMAPLVARDAFFGALLLYFSRPVLRAHYLVARVLATAGLGTLLLALPALLVVLAHLLTLGFSPGGSPLPQSLAPLMWPLISLAVVVASAAAATALALVALACGVVVRSPSSAPLLLGGGVLASLVVSWVMQAAWGRESVARSLDLHHALACFNNLLLMPLSPEAVPRFALSQALLGVAVWGVLAGGAWALLQRFLANPPLGRGRA